MKLTGLIIRLSFATLLWTALHFEVTFANASERRKALVNLVLSRVPHIRQRLTEFREIAFAKQRLWKPGSRMNQILSSHYEEMKKSLDPNSVQLIFPPPGRNLPTSRESMHFQAWLLGTEVELHPILYRVDSRSPSQIYQAAGFRPFVDPRLRYDPAAVDIISHMDSPSGNWVSTSWEKDVIPVLTWNSYRRDAAFQYELQRVVGVNPRAFADAKEVEVLIRLANRSRIARVQMLKLHQPDQIQSSKWFSFTDSLTPEGAKSLMKSFEKNEGLIRP